MRVLVTGGCGFAGSHFVEHCLRSTDWDIVVLDSLSYAGTPDRLTDISSYDPNRVAIMWWDLNAPLNAYIDHRIGPIDYVVHYAADSHVDNSINDPKSVITNNTNATLNLLEWWRTTLGRREAVKGFVQISTDEVYGACPLGRPGVEWDPILPSNPYSSSKACQEAIAISYWRTYNLPLLIVNCMNLIGERQHPEKFVPKVLRTILQGKEVPLHGRPNGSLWEWSSRHWLHCRNLADAILFLLARPRAQWPHNEWPDRYNVAGLKQVDVFEMAHLIAQTAGRPLLHTPVNFHDSRPGHDMHYSLNGDKLAALGWKAPMPFEASLRKTVRWMLEHPEWLDV